MAIRISHDDRTQLFDALRRGIPPAARGLLAINVGRDNEVKELLSSIKTAMGGGYAFRVVTGNYGAGKTFLLELMRSAARSNKAAMLSMRVELSPDRRFIGSTGQPTELWRSLISSLTTNDTGEAGDHQLRTVLDRFATKVGEIGLAQGKPIKMVVEERLAHVARLEHGDQLAAVVRGYWMANLEGDETKMRGAVQWIKAGFDSKVEARRVTGVGYKEIGLVSRLQLLSALARAAGWNGLFVCIDEVDKLVQIPHETNRQANYQEVLRLCNLDGDRAPGLAVVLSGAHAFVDHDKFGAKSVPALYRRLSPNPWVQGVDSEDLIDHRSTVLRLQNLSADDSRILLSKIRALYFHTEAGANRVPEEAVDAFITQAQSFVGNETHLKPSETVKSFVHFLDLLDQNPNVDWRSRLMGVHVKRAEQDEAEVDQGEDNDDGQRI